MFTKPCAVRRESWLITPHVSPADKRRASGMPNSSSRGDVRDALIGPAELLHLPPTALWTPCPVPMRWAGQEKATAEEHTPPFTDATTSLSGSTRSSEPWTPGAPSPLSLQQMALPAMREALLPQIWSSRLYNRQVILQHSIGGELTRTCEPFHLLLADGQNAPPAFLISRPRAGGTYGRFRYGLHLRSGQMVGIKEATIAPRAYASPTDKHGFVRTQAVSEHSFLLELTAQQFLSDALPVFDVLLDERKPRLFAMMPLLTASLFEVASRMSLSQRPQVVHRLFVPMALQLGRIHNLGWIHGDIKTGNVLLDTTGQPHFSDFGAARACMYGQTLPPEFISTYPAPEIVQGMAWSHSADVFSFGAMLLGFLQPQMLELFFSHTTGAFTAHLGPQAYAHYFAKVVDEHTGRVRWSDVNDVAGFGEQLIALRETDQALVEFVYARMMHPVPSKRCTAMTAYTALADIEAAHGYFAADFTTILLNAMAPYHEREAFRRHRLMTAAALYMQAD